MTDIATLAAILYAARLQRRVPESEGEKRRAIADALADARLIVESVGVPTAEATPEHPPPSPGTIGRRPKADAKAPRRRR